MNDRMYAGMAEATRLTREGRLAEATALIQQHLGRTQVPTSTPTDLASAPGLDDGTFRAAEGPETVKEPAALGQPARSRGRPPRRRWCPRSSPSRRQGSVASGPAVSPPRRA